MHTFGDAHLYVNHLEQADTQLARTPKPLPRLRLDPRVCEIGAFTYDDVELLDYDCDGPIKAPIAV